MKTATKTLCAALVLILLFSLGACGKKRKPISAEKFQSTMEDDGFLVQDVTSSTIGGSRTETILVARDTDKAYQIEFFVFKEQATALASFEQNKQNFEDEGSGTSSSMTKGNFMKYEKTTDDTYMVIVMIEKTLMYCKTDKDNKDTVQKYFKTLGYK